MSHLRAGANQQARTPIVPILFFGLGLAFLILGAWKYTQGRDRWSDSLLPDDWSQIEPELAERIRILGAAARDHPSDATAYGDLGILYEAHGLNNLARACYDRAATATADDPRWRYFWAALVHLSGDLEAAEPALREVIATAPSHAPAHERLGVLLVEQLRFQDAIHCFERVIQLKPNRPEGYVRAGEAELMAGRPKAAVERLSHATRLAPKNREAHFLLGRAYRELGEGALADAEIARGGGGERELLPDPWRRGIQEARVTQSARFDLASRLIADGRMSEATIILESLVTQDPGNPDILNNLAVAYQALGRVPEAKPFLRRALQSERGRATTYRNLALVAMAERDPAAALDYAEQAIEVAPTAGAGFLTKGCALAQMQRYGEALTALEIAERFDPQLPELFLFKGQTLVGLNRWDEAALALETAVAREPRSAKARYKLAVAYGKKGLLDRAVEQLQAAQVLDPTDLRTKAALQRLGEVRRRR